MIARLKHWWDGWLSRELRPPIPGAFPQAFLEINYRHPRTRLTMLVRRDPMADIEQAFRQRETAYRRRGYRGEW